MKNNKRNYPYFLNSHTAIEELKKYCGKYDSKVHYVELGQSIFIKISKFLDRCICPLESKYDYIPPDEIDINVVANIFCTENQICDDFMKECVLLSMAALLRKRVNRFYSDIKRGSVVFVLKTDFKNQEKEYLERYGKDLKLIRGVK